MRILHIIASVNPAGGGPIEGIIRQSQQLSAGETREIVSLDRPCDDWVSECPVTVYALGDNDPHILPLEHYRYSTGFVSWLKQNVANYDFVVVNGLWNYTTFGAARVLPKSGVPYVVFSHGMLDPWFRKTYPLKHVAKQLLWLVADGVLAANSKSMLFTTEEERRLARGEFWGHRYPETVVSYGTAAPPPYSNEMADAFFSSVPDLSRKRFLLYLSRIHRKKGGDLLLEAFASIANDHPDLDLVMAGPGDAAELSKLKALAIHLGLASRVHWPGQLRGAAKWGAFYLCEAFCLPSHQENFGIVVAEALACGKAVLISRRVNICHEVREADAGLVEDDTSQGTTRLLKTWMSLDLVEKQRIERNAKDLFCNNFDIAIVNPRLNQLFFRLSERTFRKS